MATRKINNAETVIDQAGDAGREQFDRAAGAMFNGLDEVTAYNRRSWDAMVRASAAMTRNVEELSRSWFAFTQGTVEQSMSTAKAMLGARNLREVMDLQSEYARTTFDALVSESTRWSEMALKSANEAIAPVQARFDEAAERAKTAA